MFSRDDKRAAASEKKGAGRFPKKPGLITTILASAAAAFVIGGPADASLVKQPRRERTYLNLNSQIPLMAASPRTVVKTAQKQLNVSLKVLRKPPSSVPDKSGMFSLYAHVGRNKYIVASVDRSWLPRDSAKRENVLLDVTKQMVTKHFRNPSATSFTVTMKVVKAPAKPSTSLAPSSRLRRRRRGSLGSGLSIAPRSPGGKISITARGGPKISRKAPSRSISPKPGGSKYNAITIPLAVIGRGTAREYTFVKGAIVTGTKVWFKIKLRTFRQLKTSDFRGFTVSMFRKHVEPHVRSPSGGKVLINYGRARSNFVSSMIRGINKVLKQRGVPSR